MAKLTGGNRGTIAGAEPPAKGQRFIFDDHRDAPRGFGLRITAAGGKAFILKYTIDGRERRKTIGPWPTWTLEAARAQALELAFDIAKGLDPLEAQRRRRGEPTVKDLAEEWLEKHATGLRSERAIRGYVLNDIVPALGRMKVSDVRRRSVIELVEQKAERTPRAAAQVLLYARRLLDYATDREWIPANPLAGLRPASITVKGRRDPLKFKARGRVLDCEEIAKFWQSAETCGMHRLTALALKLILLTGQRPGEVAGMHVDEIEGRIWTVPADRRGKTDSAHRVYLVDTALEIIEAARQEVERVGRRRKEPWAGFVFETTPGRPVATSGLCRAVTRAHEALGAKQDRQWGYWTPHDLRRTMRTGLSICKVRPDIAELTIGHVKRGIVAVYDQHGFDAERRAALERWERRLLSLVIGDGEAGNVIELGAAANERQ